jgi:hypothetical protein
LWLQTYREVGKLQAIKKTDEGKWAIEFVCSCGASAPMLVRVSDVRHMVAAGTGACRRCAGRERMAKYFASLSPEQRVVAKREIAERVNSEQARKTRAAQQRRAVSSQLAAIGVTREEFYKEVLRASGAKRRCTVSTNLAYPHYGGRGVRFLFDSPTQMAEYVLAHLGPPKEGCSIDRIDNNRHYEPGNLRWATHAEQQRNKRAYRVSEIGARIRRLRVANPRFSYETIRSFIKEGLSDEQITNREKTTRGRPRTRL